MALEGSLSDFGLADILQLIFFQRKTGVLTLEGRLDSVTLTFVDGNIAGAESRKRLDENRLGKILLKKGIIAEDDLQSALDEQRTAGSKLGSVLIRRGLVDKDTILEIVTNQITETVIQLFSWKQGTYEFVSQAVHQDKDLRFSLDTQHLLMEGMRIVDEWSLIRGRITLDTVFKRAYEPPASLTDEEREIVAFVDGENDVSTIIDLSGKDNFHVSKTLLSLMEKKAVEAMEALPVLVETKTAEPKPGLALLKYLPHAVVTISLLVSLAVAGLLGGDSVKVMKASEQVDNLRFRIEAYRISHGSLPPDLGSISKATDPWGKDYIYEPSGQGFLVLSSGPDRKAGTADDIR